MRRSILADSQAIGACAVSWAPMRERPLKTLLNWKRSPMEVAAEWPANTPLVMLHSGRIHPQWARWSILASPAVRYQFDGRSRWIGMPPRELGGVAFTNDPLRDLDAILAATRISGAAESGDLPFAGGWIGFISYDLGRWIEPRAAQPVGAEADRSWPLIELAWCPEALAFDQVEKLWWAVGPSGFAERVLETKSAMPVGGGFEIGEFRPRVSRDQYEASVRRTIEYIAAGDIFQANIAQRFTAPFDGSTRALAGRAFEQGQPWYGAYLEMPGGKRGEESRAVISLSPELFLHIDGATKKITTRPIKGTRAASAHPSSLLHSPKDAAELHMIVDLMRNDLGRICEFGSVEVSNPRSIESHPTVHHGVGEVVGRVRPGVRFSDVLRATFPGGSVTGAPKIRAMQIIDELEPVRRGPYCGAVGCISDCGSVSLNIAIRTMLLRGERKGERFDCLTGILDYSAGAGIVADSDPASEYRETLEKTAVVQGLCDERVRSRLGRKGKATVQRVRG